MTVAGEMGVGNEGTSSVVIIDAATTMTGAMTVAMIDVATLTLRAVKAKAKGGRKAEREWEGGSWMMMTGKDEWVRAAMMDDLLVVELLIRLKQSEAASLSHKSDPLPFTWGLKQPRSRSRKDADSTRCSPTTPLSWSRAASPSEHSHPPRSKATTTATSEYTGNSASTKRCRRKKEIANVSATFKVQRTRNESLKRLKLEKSNNNVPSSRCDECTISKVQQTHVTEDDTEAVAGRCESTGESMFLIPDLNMMPSEVDSQLWNEIK
ncbi:uncharacterized protein G2W53_031249 [Senna tora]|uniref:Uncharacterized protein n=1 Tax=Senna tora TaxID=362788 RepID=A0A834WBK9_9FABA|nr:uncharacterized protein G2W53_031249 [Senna tora]